jgi:TetR/AcrR family transcriptional repressor of nem operon
VKVSKEQAARNRQALVEAAARLVGERGIDGVGVAEISKEAGLTHGALYAQFPSKEALVAEALTHRLKRGYSLLAGTSDDRGPTLADFLDFYLSKQHRDDAAGGCAMAASASEISRQDQTICTRFTEGFELMVGALTAGLEATASPEDRRQRALVMASAMIGGVAVARAAAGPRPELSDEILVAVRCVLGELGGAPPRSPRRPAAPQIDSAPVVQRGRHPQQPRKRATHVRKHRR